MIRQRAASRAVQLVIALAVLLAACQPEGPERAADPVEPPAEPAEPVVTSLCEAEARSISEVQGTGFVSPLLGERVTVHGVVILTSPSGVYIQSAQPFSQQDASHGLFIASADLSGTTSTGELIAVEGTVEELGEGDDTLTAIAGALEFAQCGEGPELPEIDARLPRSDAELEALEGMRIRLDQALTVTGVRDVHEGRVRLSALGVLRAPTEVAPPGEEARAQADKNNEWSIPVANDALRELEPYTAIHVGAVVNSLGGVLTHDGSQLSLLAEGALQWVPRPLAPVPERQAGDIRIVGFNLHEYFNGDGRGDGFPGERGAETGYDFRAQVERIVAAVEAMRPDILGVMELENDGYGPLSAVHHLRRQVSQALGAEYEVSEPLAERAGTDAIAVGMVYRTDRVIPHGPARLLEGGSFGPENRVPLAQVFTHRETDTRFLVVVNHLKSKGSCPGAGGEEPAPDADQGDGQACWNDTRAEGAVETLRWARQMAAESGTDHILMIGDFNAYRMEDPVRALLEAGLVELVQHFEPDMPHYSYVYRGAAGTLDYAFATESLSAIASRALIWHINAGYPYSERPSEPWLRSSDHDPVVIDLRFSQPETSD